MSDKTSHATDGSVAPQVDRPAASPVKVPDQPTQPRQSGQVDPRQLRSLDDEARGPRGRTQRDQDDQDDQARSQYGRPKDLPAPAAYGTDQPPYGQGGQQRTAGPDDTGLDAKFAAIARGVKLLCDAGVGGAAAADIACHLVCGSSPGATARQAR